MPGGVYSRACSQKLGSVPDQRTNDICLRTDGPCWDEVLGQPDSMQKDAEKPESRQQIASWWITLENKELLESETNSKLLTVHYWYDIYTDGSPKANAMQHVIT